MKYKIFDVVKMRDNNKAVILEKVDKNKYFCEVVNPNNGKTVEKRIITEDEIKEPDFIKEK